MLRYPLSGELFTHGFRLKWSKPASNTEGTPTIQEIIIC